MKENHNRQDTGANQLKGKKRIIIIV